GAMAYAVQIQRQAQVFSQNAVRPSGTLNTPNHLSDDVKTRLKQDFDSVYSPGGGNFGKVAVLSGGMGWQPFNTMTDEDTALIEARQWSVGDVARIFGISPWLLGDSTRMTFASAREAMRSFAMLTLQPWARRIETAFQATVLTPQYRLRID